MNKRLERARAKVKSGAKTFWGVLSRNVWMKVLSLLLAILLWNYVVTNNASITRQKVISGLNGYLTNQSTLTANKLALLDDAEEMMQDITVRIEAPQADYPRVSAENVKVTLDLSSVRTAGTQQVPLRATTVYGRVVSIYPETMKLTFETLDSRVIPVNVQASGEKRDDLWYSISRTNPVSITVSGAASVVRSLTQARVNSDVTGAEEGYMRAEPYTLIDASGEQVSQAMLSCSSSSITVTMEIYPTKDVPIASLPENVITGSPAEGYEITEISIQPETVNVAADQELLNGINELYIEPVNVEGSTQSISARAKLLKLNDFRNVSVEQVLVNITIAEETISEWIEDVPLKYVDQRDDLWLDAEVNRVRVRVTGPRSLVEAIRAEDIDAAVNLAGLEAGSHSCRIEVAQDAHPELTFETEPAEVGVELTAVEAE